MLFERSRDKTVDPQPTPGDGRVTAIHKLGRQRLLLGLRWRALRNTEPSMRRNEAKEAATVANTNFAALLESGTGRAMLGLYSPSCGVAAKRAVSGAALLACTVDARTWLIVSLGPDLWWFARVRPSEVEAGGDLVGDSDTIGRAIDTAYTDAQRDGGEELPRILADVTSMPDSRVLETSQDLADEVRLDALLANASMAKLARFIRIRGIAPEYIWGTATVVGLVVVGVVGWHFYQSYLDRVALEQAQRDAALRAQQAAQIASLREAAMVRAVGDALARDTATPAASAVVRRGWQGVMVFNPYAAGWQMTEATLSPTSIQSQWRYSNGSVADNASFLAYASSISANGSVAPDLQGASLTFPLAVAPARQALTMRDLPTASDVTLRFGTWAQRYMAAYPEARISIKAPTPKAVTFSPPSQGGDVPPESVPADRTYLVGQYTADGTGLASFRSFSPDFSFVTLGKVTFRYQGAANGYEWHVEGTYFAAP